MTNPSEKLTHNPILLVDTRVAALRRTNDLLRRAGYQAIEATTFDDAKRILVSVSASVLISSLRLGAFNGLHLVHLARLARPEMTTIIISGRADATLQQEMDLAGASLLVEPVPPSTLLSLLAQTIARTKADPSLCDRRHADRR